MLKVLIEWFNTSINSLWWVQTEFHMCRRINYHCLVVAYLTLNVKWVLSHNFWTTHLCNMMKSQKGFIFKDISQVLFRTTLNYFLFSVLTTCQYFREYFSTSQSQQKIGPSTGIYVAGSCSIQSWMFSKHSWSYYITVLHVNSHWLTAAIAAHLIKYNLHYMAISLIFQENKYFNRIDVWVVIFLFFRSVL